MLRKKNKKLKNLVEAASAPGVLGVRFRCLYMVKGSTTTCGVWHPTDFSELFFSRDLKGAAKKKN